MSCSQTPNHIFYVDCTGIEPSPPGPSMVRRKLQVVQLLTVLLWELLVLLWELLVLLWELLVPLWELLVPRKKR
jgi:hypothetical protein